MAYTIFILKNDPQLASAYVAVGTLILALVTSLAVGLTWISIRRSEEKEKRDRKERLLNEIIEWAIEIQTNSLSVDIPFVKDVSPGTITAHVEAASMLKYAATFTKNEYIRAIAKKAFEKELRNEVDKIIKIFTIFLYLRGKVLGMENVEKAFKGTASTLIEKTREQTKDDPATTNKLLKEYEIEIAKSVNQLLVKAGETAANLI